MQGMARDTLCVSIADKAKFAGPCMSKPLPLIQQLCLDDVQDNGQCFLNGPP
jgi:hypothetical protein